MFLRFFLVFLTGITVAILWTVSPPRLMEDLYPPSPESEDIVEPTAALKPEPLTSKPEPELGSRIDVDLKFNDIIEETTLPSEDEPSFEPASSTEETSVGQDIVIAASDQTTDSLLINRQNEQAHSVIAQSEHYQQQPAYAHAPQHSFAHQNSYVAPQTHPAMNINNLNLFQYRRMMLNHSAPQPHELQGSWRGINKGVATLAIDKQFIKHFQFIGGQVYGDNISVHQTGGQPIHDHSTGGLKRGGKFQVQNPRGIGAFRHGAILSYRRGGNRLLDPANLIEDKLVKLDDNHMLGRATANFGPIKIPLAFFVLERIQ